MPESSENKVQKAMIKVVYFDEQSASDYLDISAGGKSVATSEDVAKRTSELHAKVDAKLTAKLSWLPFIGASAETGAGFDASRAGQSILSKTLSNTILTDYLSEVEGDERIHRLSNMKMTAPRESMAFMKMYTPYMIIAKTDDQGVDLARLDEALEGAKGYYELLAEDTGGQKRVLRFNIKAFRNNYGLADLSRMRLVFHGVLVGETTEAGLNINSEIAQDSDPVVETTISALDLIDSSSGPVGEALLDVFDVILAGVEDGR